MNRLITATIGILLSSCVGVNYGQPKPAIKKTWVDTTNLGTQSISLDSPPAQWWEGFNDPILSSLIIRGLQSNFDLAQAKSRVQQAKATRDAVSSSFWPALDLGGQAQRTRTAGRAITSSGLGSVASDSGGAATIRNNFQYGLDVAWEVDLFGGVRRSIEAADADVQAVAEQFKDVQVSLLAEIATQYVSLRAFQQRLVVARDNVTIQQKNAEITRKRFNVGFTSILDVANADGQLATTSAVIPQLETSARQAIYNLSLLVGQEPAALLNELEPSKPIPALPLRVSVGMPAELLRRRPDIRQAEYELQAATARVGVAIADYYPKLTLGAGLGVSGIDKDALGNWSNHFWNIAGSLIQPVFDAGRRSAVLGRQEFIREEIFQRYYASVLLALNEVESTLVAYRQEHIRRSTLERAAASNNKALQAAMQLYVAGNTNFIDVLDAQRSLYSTQDSLTQSIQREDVLLISLYKALGGGWEIQPEV